MTSSPLKTSVTRPHQAPCPGSADLLPAGRVGEPTSVQNMSRGKKSPDNGDGKELATRDQIEFIRKYSDLDEAALTKLGKEEAADLIDKLQEERQRAELEAVPRGLGIGYVKGLMILVLIAAIAATLWLLTHRNPDGSLHWPESIDEVIASFGETGSKPAPNGEDRAAATNPESPIAVVPPKEPPPKVPPPEPTPPESVWPPTKLPASYRAIKPVELLAEDGSKVPIEVGQTLHVIESPRPNIWKFSYKGIVLIGSASRVEGKLGPLGN
jgi:cytoskeletal protein RodZ